MVLSCMRTEISNWLEQAERDLITSENSFNARDYYASVFWSQQAVEKGLKALFIFKENKPILKVHDLTLLCDKVHAPEKIYKIAEKLTPSYIFARYPESADEIPARMYNKDQTNEFLTLAKEALLWIKKELKL